MMRSFIVAILALFARASMAEPGPLVFAASSLTDALEAAADVYAASGQPKPTLSFAASSALARQIERGAPAEVFLSADEAWMDYLAERNLVDPTTRRVLLGNRIVLISPRQVPFLISIEQNFPLGQKLAGRALAMADPDSVPAGRYAKLALETLGVWSEVEALVVRAESARAALAIVARGEAAAGIVYETDALATPAVMTVSTFPENSHPPVIYSLALVGSSPSRAARAFRAFLHGPEATAVFRRFGFLVPALP